MFFMSSLFSWSACCATLSRRPTTGAPRGFREGHEAGLRLKCQRFEASAGRRRPEIFLHVTGRDAYGEVETRNSLKREERLDRWRWHRDPPLEQQLDGQSRISLRGPGRQGGTTTVGAAPLVFSQVSNVDFKDHIVRVGLNYKLGNWAYRSRISRGRKTSKLRRRPGLFCG